MGGKPAVAHADWDEWDHKDGILSHGAIKACRALKSKMADDAGYTHNAVKRQIPPSKALG